MLRETWRRFGETVARLEELPWGPGRTFALLAGIIAVRNLLEITVARNPVFPALAAFVHYPLAYLAPALALVLVLAALAGVAPARVARLMALAWLLTLAPPVLDLLLHPGREVPTIAYLQADPSDLGWVFLHFFDPRVVLPGTTAGIRLEALAAVLLGALYVLLRSGKPLRALAALPAIYLVSLFFFSLPVIVYGLFRLPAPGLTRDAFAHGEGILYLPDTDSTFDGRAISWLVPLVLVLGFFFRRLEARHGEGWLAPGKGDPGSAGAVTAWSLPLLGGVLFGVLAGRLLWFPPEAVPPRSPWDLLGTLSCLLAVPLLLASVSLLAGGAHGPGFGSALLGSALLAALGRGPALSLLALAGAAAPVLAGILPRGTASRLLSSAIAGGPALLAAFAAGFSLVIGPEGPARIPRPVLPWLVVGGMVVMVLAELGRRFSPSARLRPVVPLLLGAALVLGGTGVLASSPVRASLHDDTRNVGRLARIRGERLLRRGQLDRARSWLRRALKLNPADADAERQLGLLYLAKGRTDMAEAHLRRALELAPRSPANLANLASLLLRQDRPAEALELLKRAREEAPRDLVVLFNRAEALDALGRREEAIAAWRVYLRLAAPRPSERESVRHARRRLRALEEGRSPGGSSPPGITRRSPSRGRPSPAPARRRTLRPASAT